MANSTRPCPEDPDRCFRLTRVKMVAPPESTERRCLATLPVPECQYRCDLGLGSMASCEELVAKGHGTPIDP